MGRTSGRRRLTRHNVAVPGAALDHAGMNECEVCGNEYAMAFVVEAQGARHVFDSFECAIHRMAPICEHCGCRVIGHGVEADGRFFCGAHCAGKEGAKGLVDHV